MDGPGAYIFGCAGPELSESERAFFREADPWGFILFTRNAETPDALRRLTAELRESVGRDAPILIDQEGGRVQRLRPPLARDWEPALDAVAAAGAKAERMLFLRAQRIGLELVSYGIDVNCVPLADLAFENTHEVLRNRCYGRTPDEVDARARAVAAGSLAGGVLPVLKHIPGHGRATADSHETLPRIDVGLDTLWLEDFAPFTQLADLPLGMTAHVVFEAVDPDAPATLSADVIRLIREEIGFTGLLMTDDLSMGALGGTMAARTRGAVAAGCDVILHCNGDMAEMAEIAGAASPMSGGAAIRAAEALALRRAPRDVDIDALEAELLALAGGRADA